MLRYSVEMIETCTLGLELLYVSFEDLAQVVGTEYNSVPYVVKVTRNFLWTRSTFLLLVDDFNPAPILIMLT